MRDVRDEENGRKCEWQEYEICHNNVPLTQCCRIQSSWQSIHLTEPLLTFPIHQNKNYPERKKISNSRGYHYK
jgi:hypothetical protein